MPLLPYALTSVADVKTYLGITVTSDDALLEMFINQGTDWIESYCGNRRFLDSTYTDEVYESQFTSSEQQHPTIERNRQFWLSTKQYPITDTQAVIVKYRNGTSVWDVQNADVYDTYEDRGQIYLFAGMPNIRKAIKLTYSAGYETIPNDLALACIKLVARQYEKRKSQGKKQESIGGATIVWADTAVESMDGDVMNVLNQYRRKAI